MVFDFDDEASTGCESQAARQCPARVRSRRQAALPRKMCLPRSPLGPGTPGQCSRSIRHEWPQGMATLHRPTFMGVGKAPGSPRYRCLPGCRERAFYPNAWMQMTSSRSPNYVPKNDSPVPLYGLFPLRQQTVFSWFFPIFSLFFHRSFTIWSIPIAQNTIRSPPMASEDQHCGSLHTAVLQIHLPVHSSRVPDKSTWQLL